MVGGSLLWGLREWSSHQRDDRGGETTFFGSPAGGPYTSPIDRAGGRRHDEPQWWSQPKWHERAKLHGNDWSWGRRQGDEDGEICSCYARSQWLPPKENERAKLRGNDREEGAGREGEGRQMAQEEAKRMHGTACCGAASSSC